VPAQDAQLRPASPEAVANPLGGIYAFAKQPKAVKAAPEAPNAEPKPVEEVKKKANLALPHARGCQCLLLTRYDMIADAPCTDSQTRRFGYCREASSQDQEDAQAQVGCTSRSLPP
jgi:hypothetical protein